MTEIELMKHIGDNIQEQLDEWGMTQGELADDTGINKSSISRYINGEVMPSLKNLINISYVFGCDITEIIPADERII